MIESDAVEHRREQWREQWRRRDARRREREAAHPLTDEQIAERRRKDREKVNRYREKLRQARGVEKATERDRRAKQWQTYYSSRPVYSPRWHWARQQAAKKLGEADRRSMAQQEREMSVNGDRVVSYAQTALHYEAFEVWYEFNRSFSRTANKMGLGDAALRRWAQKFDWDQRANDRDAEAERIAARDAIKRRAKMIERHRQAGALMVHRGTQFFANKANPNETPIERTADAINAVAKGIEIERTAEALPTWIFELLEADDETLATIVRQAAAAQDTGIGSSSGPLALTAGDGDVGGRGDSDDASGDDLPEWQDDGNAEEGSDDRDTEEYARFAENDV